MSPAIDTDPFGAVERFVPEEAPGSLIEAEHEARYRWAAPAVQGRAVLDAGCGVGYGTAILAGAGAARAVGIDISPEAIEHAHDRYGEAGGFVVGDLQALPFADDTFAAAVCFEAIEHVADPSRALDELRRVLRPDGLLLISSPNRDVYPPGNPFHVHEYRPAELEEALALRFGNVRLYRQRSHYTSLIRDDRAPGEVGPDREPRVRMLEAEPEPEEMYAVAVAGDGALPEMEPLLLVGGTFEGRSWHDLAWSWQERVLMAEAAATASDVDAAAARQEAARSLELLGAGDRRVVRAGRPVARRLARRLWGIVRGRGP
jgi:SAM-dependent methyltransferase